jgi:hypothetical protein
VVGYWHYFERTFSPSPPCNSSEAAFEGVFLLLSGWIQMKACKYPPSLMQDAIDQMPRELPSQSDGASPSGGPQLINFDGISLAMPVM